MTNQAALELLITMPAGLVPTGSTNVLRLPMVEDSAIRGGKRAIERAFVDANGSGPTRRQKVEWAIHGPLGASLESSAGYLGINLTQNLDGRWYQRLIPVARQNHVDLTSADPPGVAGAYFGTAYFGTSYFGSPVGGGHSGDGPDVVVFAEQNGYLLVMRGPLLTQVDTRTTPWTVVSTTVLDSPAEDADRWRGSVKIALGPTSAMQRVVGVSAGGIVLEDVVATSPAETVYASAIKRGSDRAWYINANQSQSSYNFAGFTLDDFVNLANPFQVGDPDAGMNGIGPFGPLTLFGGMDNLYSFTDQGKPVPLSRALYSHLSEWNGNQWADPGWTWNFATSGIGLRAISPGGIDNPVGIGETMRQFTGHNGIAYTVYSERGELWVIYYTTSGQIYGYRGTFGPETGASGQPLLFPWFYKADAWSQAIFSTVTGAPDQGTFIIHGDGTDLVYSVIASDGRDDLFPDYAYDTTGPFAAYLTTLNRNANLLKTLRLARFRTDNLLGTSSWTLAFAFDAVQTDITSATYIPIGTVMSDGAQTLTPVSAGAPLANISGRTITPRFTLIATATITNYVTNPSFETSTAGWSSGATIAQSTQEAQFGTESLKMAGTVVTAGASISVSLPHAGTYTLSGYVFMPGGNTGDLATTLGLACVQVIGGIGQTVISGSVDSDDAVVDAWQRVDVTFEAPVSVTDGPLTFPATCTLSLTSSLLAGQYCFLDGVMVEETDELTQYIDGNQGQGYAWTGTTNLSTSTYLVGTGSPPEIDGTLEVEYDERPAQTEQISVACYLTSVSGRDENEVWSLLQSLVGENVDAPMYVQIPDNLPPGVSVASGGGTYYAFLTGVEKRQDLTRDDVEGVTLIFNCWPQGSAI